MSLPLKALDWGQLKFKKGGAPVETSGHEVLRVTIQDADGKFRETTGFFKPLDETYPAPLAKYAVACSVIMRLTCPRVAEERLVFKDGEIAGTVSYTVPDWTPMQGNMDPNLDDAWKQELACPSIPTLLAEDVAEELVELWGNKEDDAHKGNFSLRALIDRDMGFYPYTQDMKGGRWVDGVWKEVPSKAMVLKRSDLDNFPNISGRTHWPTNGFFPGNWNFFKGFWASSNFQALAGEPVFQEQMFVALLKKLIVYDPELLRARLTEYFGDIPLDFHVLREDKREKVSQNYPKLFNAQTNSDTFVNHMLSVCQQEYNELYSVVVFYMGCPINSKGIAVSSFCQFLQNKPSAFKKVVAWAIEQNKLIDAAWLSQPGETLGPIAANAIPIAGRYNLETIEKRYHKVWRDAHVPLAHDCKFLLKALSRKVLEQLVSKSITSAPPEEQGLQIDDPELTDTWQLFAEDHKPSSPECEPSNSVGAGLAQLDDFINSLLEETRTYCRIEASELTDEDNQQYIKKLTRLLEKYEVEIYKLFASTSWSTEFQSIVKSLVVFYNSLNLQRHKFTFKDSPLETKVQHDYVALLNKQHTDEDIIELAIQTLFDWVGKIGESDAGLLDDYILNVIDNGYEPGWYNILANRKRAEHVKSYLKTSSEDSVAKLGYILSHGKCDAKSLNTLLIQHLIPLVLKDEISVLELNLMSVAQAVERGLFDAGAYARHAQSYAQKNPRFSHDYSEDTVRRINEAMYRWVRLFKPAGFRKSIIEEALNLYKPYSLNFFSSKQERYDKVKSYLDDPSMSNSALLASVFSAGGITDTSLNYHLFKILLNKMQANIASRKERLEDPDYALIMTIKIPDANAPDPVVQERFDYYLSSLAHYAKIRNFSEMPATKLKVTSTASASTI